MRLRRSSDRPAPVLIVGLGNPGSQYEDTRHNVGQEVARIVAGGTGFTGGPRRVMARVAQGVLAGRPCVVALPTTFMNRSGDAVSALVSYYKVEPADVVVIHDDIDLPFGRLRFHFGRGPGGNNGVASVIRSLGTRDFWRMRIGVGRPPGRMDPADFVLRRFSGSERPLVDLMVREAADVIEAFVAGGGDAAKEAAGEATRRLGET
jgi:peptidyl-tRNA hydrolase, PTH1 family